MRVNPPRRLHSIVPFLLASAVPTFPPNFSRWSRKPLQNSLVHPLSLGQLCAVSNGFVAFEKFNL